MPFEPDKPTPGFTPDQQQKGMIGKAWDALAVPEQMSKQGLNMLAEAYPWREPTGNKLADVAYNAPGIALQTMAEAAPGFVSRGSILAGGLANGAKAIAPAAKAVAGQAAKGLESLSGLEYKTPGVLTEAFKDAGLLFGKGKAAAGKLFEGLIDNSKMRPVFSEAMSSDELLKAAREYAKDGTLTPSEALVARQTLDASKRSIPTNSYYAMRDAFDSVAKNISQEADIAFKRAVKSEALRNIFAINKGGGASIFKLGIGHLTGLNALMSPILQGSVATGAGMATRAVSPLVQNPEIAGALPAILPQAQAQISANIPQSLQRFARNQVKKTNDPNNP